MKIEKTSENWSAKKEFLNFCLWRPFFVVQPLKTVKNPLKPLNFRKTIFFINGPQNFFWNMIKSTLNTETKNKLTILEKKSKVVKARMLDLTFIKMLNRLIR